MNQIGFWGKTKIALNNEMIAHSALGLSILNVGNSILFLNKTIDLHSDKIKEYDNRLKDIRRSFDSNKKLIRDFPEDQEQALKLMIDIGKKLNKNKEDIEQFLEDIEADIKGERSERNHNYLRIVQSIVQTAFDAFGVAVSEGSNKLEYSIAAIGNLISTGAYSANAIENKNYIKKLYKYKEKAKGLERDIIEQIAELEKLYNLKLTQHHPKGFY